jgi:integrase
MLKLFRAAGIPEVWQGGKRSHNWRDTLAMEILEDEEGRLEDAQIALGHKSRKTTEKYYTAISKKRAERVTQLKKKLWALEEAAK